MAAKKGAKAASPEVPPGDGEAASDVKVKKGLLLKAIRAIMQIVAKKSANTNPLFEDRKETMIMQFNLGRIPDRRIMRPALIHLPHPMYGATSDICYIAKDPQKKYKEMFMEKHPIPGLSKVIGLQKLRRNYKTLEQKRALADAFDLFLCDSRIVEMMPQVLGVVFYRKKNKPPIPVKLKEGGDDPRPNLQKAIDGTCVRIPTGPTLGVKFGRVSNTEEELAKNAAAVISGVLQLLSKHSLPLQGISVQAIDTMSLPVWRRPKTEIDGKLLDLKKYRSDASSSSASDTGASGAMSDSEIGMGSELSDAGETLSSRDTISELETGGETMSELDTAGESELDEITPKKDLPLVRGLSKKRRLPEPSKTKAVAEEPSKPAKKAKKGKA